MDAARWSGLDIPNVRLEGPLGQGGFGVVLRGHHLGLDIDVAVKVLDADAGDPSALERALGEARLMARLDHPNILRVHDAGRVGAAIYLVLEIMDGGNCATLRRVEAGRGLELARQLLSGLQSLHEARIIHRDIKPANCLLRQKDDRVKLADLGIAVEQETRREMPLDFGGTLPFMAPELFEDTPRYGVASDLYALGMTLACFLLPDPPYPSGSPPRILAWIRGGDRPRVSARRPDLPRELTGLIDRLLAREPAHRPSSASEALASIGMLAHPRTPPSLGGEVAPARTVGPWILGALVHDSANWIAYAVTHARTGSPGRLSLLKGIGPIAHTSDQVLASADRASRLDHPGILDVVDWGMNDGLAYLVTLPQGRPLQSLVESGGPVDEAEAIGYVLDIAEALSYLHAEGLVYQIVDAGTSVVAPDARGAQLAWPMFCRPIGSPASDAEGGSQRAFVPLSAAPELFEDRGTIETPGDVYGLGHLLFHLLAGRVPFGPLPLMALMVAKRSPPPDVRALNPMVTAPTARLVAHLLDPNPARRTSAAEAVKESRLLARRLGRLRLAGPDGQDPTMTAR